MREAVPLFIYGSLMSGLEHHDQLVGAEPRGKALLMDHHLVLYEGSYPALVPGSPGTGQPQPQTLCVVGELFVVDVEHLERLDSFEECPHLYQRITVTLADGTRAQAYAIGRERAQDFSVLGGDFRAFLKNSGTCSVI